MILDDMYRQYKLLQIFKQGLLDRGHCSQLAWINGQLDILDRLIQKQSYLLLDELLRKTNYRLLKSIDKGISNLPKIYNAPYEWQLGLLEENNREWISKDSLIFTTEKQALVFSKSINGYKYVGNRWQ